MATIVQDEAAEIVEKGSEAIGMTVLAAVRAGISRGATISTEVGVEVEMMIVSGPCGRRRIRCRTMLKWSCGRRQRR